MMSLNLIKAHVINARDVRQHSVEVTHSCVLVLGICSARRKQKWSVDPRNSTWSNDDSKFGQKMLERMGWSKGKVMNLTHL